MNGIDPKYVFWLGVVVSIELGIGQGVLPLSDMVPADWVHWIKGWSAGLAFIGTTIMTALSGYSSKTAGPLVKPIIILAVVLGSLFAMPNDASAQARKPVLTGNIVNDIAAATGKPGAPVLTGNIEKDAEALWSKIKSLTKADLTYAIAKATAAKTNASAVRLQCLQAINDANDQANGAGLTNADGTPMVRPDPAVVTAIEDVAELVDNLSPQGKLFTSCSGAAQMLKTNTLALINGIVTGAAGIAMLPVGL